MAEFRVHHVRFFNFVPKAIHSLTYCKRHQRLALSRADGSVEIWNLREDWFQEEIFHAVENTSIEALIWCADRLFSAGLDGEITEYDLFTIRKKRSTPSNAGAIWCLDKSPDDKYLAAGTENGCLVIFNVTDGQLEYERAFERQEGRILCVSWHVNNEVLVTGGIDNIRVWSVKSGRAILRLTLAKQAQKETIVWTVLILGDMTIVSGDSRGMTSFWNGREGTLIRDFQSHKSDVLAACANEENNSVCTSGVDSTLVQFEFISRSEESDWKIWVKSNVCRNHTHDVLALTYAGDNVISAGGDTHIIINRHPDSSMRKEKNRWRRIPPTPMRSLCRVARNANMLLLNYPHFLELWRLGQTNSTSEKNGDILPLKMDPMKLLQLQTRSGQPVVCSAISHDATWLAYSDLNTLRMYRVKLREINSLQPQISIERVKAMTPDLDSANLLTFTPDSFRLISVTRDSRLQVLRLVSDEAVTVCHTFTPPVLAMPRPSLAKLHPYIACVGVDRSLKSLTMHFQKTRESHRNIHVLATSLNSRYVATGNHSNHVCLYSLSGVDCQLTLLCTLPQSGCQAMALAFSPESHTLVTSYTDQKILEFDVKKKEYTNWTRHNMKLFPVQWLHRHSKIIHLTFNPRQPEQIIAHDEQMLCILNKEQAFPGRTKQLWIKADVNRGPEMEKQAFHISNKYRFLLHLDTLKDDWLVAVEQPIHVIREALPPTLFQKKFGT